jgi:hypothetical protein
MPLRIIGLWIMALFGWLKRFLGRLLGEQVVAFCNVCGKSVRPSDLEDGVAVIIARHAYCPACVRKIAGEKKAPRTTLPEESWSSSHTSTIMI